MFTTIGSATHFRTQLPLVRALAAAGHEVLLATTPTIAPVLEREGVRVTTCLRDFERSFFITPYREELEDYQEELLNQGDPGDQKYAVMKGVMTRVLSGPMAKMHVEAALPVAREFHPDLILRDSMDISACLIAEKLGIPQLPAPAGTLNSFDQARILPGLNALREEHGLPTNEDPLSIIPHGRIDYVPAEFTFASHLPEALSYRQMADLDRGAVLPQWVAELPTDRPLVFAAIGQTLSMARQMAMDANLTAMPLGMPNPVEELQTIVDAVSRLEECTVIVATSGAPVETGGLPPHVHITERLPQPLLLESVDLFLTHGGFNSIREALRTATPMAVLPQFGDQQDNARRAQELGVGHHITVCTAESITAACREVLTDSGIRARVRQARLEMLALPEIESAVSDLLEIAG